MKNLTLVLTPWYLPIKILRWEDAVKMRYEGTVDVIAEYDTEIRSPSVVWRMPAVVRLKRMPRTTQCGVRFSRRNVYQRDRHTCQYCGKRKPLRELSYDHVVPRAAGGRTEWRNVVTSCRDCNAKKGSRRCDECGMFPKNMPVQPLSLPLSAPLINPDTAPLEWLAFVKWVP